MKQNTVPRDCKANVYWKFNCPLCFAGPGEPCCSMSKEAQRPKFRLSQRTCYEYLKRPHPERVLQAPCPKCGEGEGQLCRSTKTCPLGKRIDTRAISLDKPHRERVRSVIVAICCYQTPMAARTACGGIENDDTAEWRYVTCKACLLKQPEIAAAYASYCGTEFEANLDNSRMLDYLDDCALQWGAENWTALTKDKRLLVRKAFEEGRQQEKSVRGGRS